jgi:hypothetical protein
LFLIAGQMADGSVRFIISVVVALITALSTIPMAYFIPFQGSYMYILLMLLVVAIGSAIISFVCNIIYQKVTCGHINIKNAGIGAGIAPIGAVAGLALGAGLPVALGCVPPRFRTRASSLKADAGMLCFLRNIPESVLSNISEDVILPIAEMFWAFWGALYGQTYAFSIIAVC